jgi:hypothetical protein
MKIKIIVPVPLGVEYGITIGRFFDVLEITKGGRGENKYWVMGDAGEKCALFPREIQEVKNENT